jgi:hypothetical protein
MEKKPSVSSLVGCILNAMISFSEFFFSLVVECKQMEYLASFNPVAFVPI